MGECVLTDCYISSIRYEPDTDSELMVKDIRCVYLSDVASYTLVYLVGVRYLKSRCDTYNT